MIDDIIDKKLLIGLAKVDIITLLGDDYEEGPCDDCIGYTTYDDGFGFTIDHKVLAIYFDSLGFAREAREDMW